MQHMKFTRAGGLFLIMGALLTQLAYADDSNEVRGYAVTITNIMHGQNLAPPSLVVHNSEYRMFELGGQATPGLQLLAETPSGAAFLSEAAAQPTVYSTARGPAIIPPGGKQTINIETTGAFPQITVATMIATTTDGFMAARNIHLPLKGAITVEAIGYDAGTEANTTDCSYNFGPPCNDLRHNPAPAEGFIHVHPGIHGGGGGLDPAIHDWRNPVAEIRVERVY